MDFAVWLGEGGVKTDSDTPRCRDENIGERGSTVTCRRRDSILRHPISRFPPAHVRTYNAPRTLISRGHQPPAAHLSTNAFPLVLKYPRGPSAPIYGMVCMYIHSQQAYQRRPIARHSSKSPRRHRVRREKPTRPSSRRKRHFPIQPHHHASISSPMPGN